MRGARSPGLWAQHLSKLAGAEESEAATRVDAHLQTAMRQLWRLHAGWHDVLPAEVLRRALGALADEVAGHLVQQVLQLESSTQAHQRRVARAVTAVEGVAGLVEGQMRDEADVPGAPGPEPQHYIPYLPRLNALRDILVRSPHSVRAQSPDVTTSSVLCTAQEGRQSGALGAVRSGALRPFTAAEQQHVVRCGACCGEGPQPACPTRPPCPPRALSGPCARRRPRGKRPWARWRKPRCSGNSRAACAGAGRRNGVTLPPARDPHVAPAGPEIGWKGATT